MYSLSLGAVFIFAAGAMASTPYSYSGETGPLMWAELDPKNYACANGTRQSPINMPLNLTTIALTSENVNYPESLDNVLLENTGHGIEFKPPAGATPITINIGGKTFAWKQAHFHTPSEHHLNDEHFPMEVHFVHKEVGNNNSAAVIGLFFDLEYTVPRGMLNAICPQLDNLSTAGSNVTINGLDLGQANQAITAAPLMTYAGSLTTPPCAEIVTFYMVKKPISLSVGQYRRMKSVMKFNARYTQNDVPKEGISRENLLELAAADFCSLKKFKF